MEILIMILLMGFIIAGTFAIAEIIVDSHDVLASFTVSLLYGIGFILVIFLTLTVVEQETVESIATGEKEIIPQYTIVKGDTIDIEYTLVKVEDDE